MAAAAPGADLAARAAALVPPLDGKGERERGTGMSRWCRGGA
jgi:hypothetical protein